MRKALEELLARNPDKAKIHIGRSAGPTAGTDLERMRTEIEDRKRNPRYFADDGVENLTISKEEYEELDRLGVHVES